MQDHEIFAAVGSEGFERLVAEFYRQVPSDEVLGPLYPPHDLQGAERRLRDFLIYRFGGPPTYIEQRGHPRLRIRHAPFAVGTRARDRWVKLMTQALDKSGFPAEARGVLSEFFDTTATFLMNRPAE